MTALRELIDAWRSHRAAEIAELVGRLSARVGQGRELPVAKTQTEALANWIARARERNPADLHVLLDELEHIVARGRKYPIKTVLNELIEWRDDPRVGVRIVQCVESRLKPQRRHWVTFHFVQALIASGDPRTRPALVRLNDGMYLGQFEARLAELGGAVTPNAEIDAACDVLRQLIDTCELDPAAEDHPRAHAPEDRKPLLDDVYADPNDDAARLVLGDWLLARGDPLGELISLQFRRREQPATDEARLRERELLEEHAKLWLGPLARLVHMHSVKFERGFPVELGLAPIKAGLVELEQGHREWATLERISFDRSMRGSGSIVSAHMRAVRELEGVCDKGLLALATECDWLPIEYLRYEPSTDKEYALQSKGAAALRECTGLDRLRSLYLGIVLSKPRTVEWLWDTKVGRQLHTFTTTGFDPLAGWTHVPSNIQRVGMCDRGNWCMMERDQAGRWTRLHMHLIQPLDEYDLAPLFHGLAADQLAEIRVELTARREQRGQWLGPLLSLIARFEGVRLEIGEATDERPPWRPRVGLV